jgi:bifunctional UDP-N-acetylglucosamine pyrophosphorylase/glucosamine-1-phosphate N-acetyltransferase
MDTNVTAIVLAAGKGTRMKAPPEKNKVTYTLAEKPIIQYTYDMLKECGFDHIIVVIGYAGDSVKAALGERVTYAVQENPQGTGHAVKTAMPFLKPNCKTVISMYGDDSAFYPPSLLEKLYQEHNKSNAAVTLVTLHKSDPTGLGRIVRDNAGNLTEIVEEKNATDQQKQIKEINTGLYCFDRQFLDMVINEIVPNPISNEYYLTDIVQIAINHHRKVHALVWPSDEIWYGVNTQEQLREAEARMKEKSAVK